ncbi:hypothetical protein [Nodularia sphaerocarpa]|uniref:hypothetical protein n=1 Tax=Nodularia sphaerocarpa TaxID=137816 RepID=UPI001EFAE1A5|nr:hypothetical protein [Nodularia sphaerocarpa]MDB9372786.1 hypothetical protein [Nodularia sphaerocarpa CS-585]MDB9379526.1 hypothetical protein [Nodularia sphaerocarpa CS-585A2]
MDKTLEQAQKELSALITEEYDLKVGDVDIRYDGTDNGSITKHPLKKPIIILKCRNGRVVDVVIKDKD